MKSTLKTERFQMLMDKPTVEAVDDWMFAHRIRTRAEAIRCLIRLGMKQNVAMRSEQTLLAAE